MLANEILESFNNKKILVTGGSGLIGRPLVDILEKAGANVMVASLDNLRLNSAVTYVKADLREFSTCRSLVENKDYVFHLAGIKGSIEVTKSKPASFFVPYLQFNTNVLEAARLAGVQKLVYTSSIGAYSSAEIFKENDITDGVPMDFFPGWAKRMAEMQIRAYKQQYNLHNFSIVRPCNVYGIGDNFDPDNAMVIPSLMSRIVSAPDRTVSVWGDGSAVRDFAYNHDVAEGIIQTLYYSPDVDFLNLGSGLGYTIRELVETLQSFIEFDVIWDETKGNGFPKRVMDITLARKLINYNPITSLREGLQTTWNWYIANRTEYLSRQNYFTESK